MRYALAILFLAAQAQAATLYVSLTGSHDTNAPAFSTWEAAATNIQSAIDAASAGDTVRVAPGTYTAAVTINKNSLTVQGGNGTLWDADRTFIDRQGAADSVGVKFDGATNSTLRGFTVTGARPAYGCGAVWIYATAKGCVIESCVVRGNQSAADFTSGIRSQGSSSEARNCIVVGNHAMHGGVSASSYLWSDGFFNIQNCIVEANANRQAYLHVDGRLSAINCVLGNALSTTHAGGNVTNNTINSVCRVLNIAPASEGVGTNLVWRGVSAYIPRIGSLAQGAGVGYTGIDSAKSGDGGPALWPIGAKFLGRDSSTNHRHASPSSGVTSNTNSPFSVGGSAQFSGQADGFAFVSATSTLVTNDFVTVEAWVRPNKAATPHEVIFASGKGSHAGSLWFEVNRSAGGVSVIGSEQILAQTDNAFATSNTWLHIAYTRSGAGSGNHALFVNGEQVALSASNTASFAKVETSPTLIGHGSFTSPTRPYGGLIAHLRVWNVARTPAEIAANYTNILTGTEAGLVGYWRLDETDTPITTGPFNLRNPTLQPTFMEAF